MMSQDSWELFKIRCNGLILLTLSMTGFYFVTKLPVFLLLACGMAFLLGGIGFWLIWICWNEVGPLRTGDAISIVSEEIFKGRITQVLTTALLAAEARGRAEELEELMNQLLSCQHPTNERCCLQVAIAAIRARRKEPNG